MSDTLPLLRLLAGQLRAGLSEDDRHRWALVVDGIADETMKDLAWHRLRSALSSPSQDYWLREVHKPDPERDRGVK